MKKINKVAIFGMGKSGKGAVALAIKKKLEVYAVSRGPVDSWYESEGMAQLLQKECCFSEDDFAHRFHLMEEIIISPGIPVTHPALKLAVAKQVPLISEIEFAFRECSNIPVVAITGTNGKTTTTSMINEVLIKAGKKVFCGGNIGIPYTDLALSESQVDYAIIEVSSFQLETIQTFHPTIGVILNIFPNHSERYDRVEDYALAKFNLLMNMTARDQLILGTENSYLEQIADHPANKTYFTKGHLPLEFRTKFNFSQAKVRGEHNEANFYVAYQVLHLLGIPQLDKLFQEFINEFKGVAHRLEFVLSSNGLNIYNDAKSTNTLATATAIKAFDSSSEPLHLIIGGKLRNETDLVLPDLLSFKGKIATIFAIGEVTERMYQELKAEFKTIKAHDLQTVFEICQRERIMGNLVFSPAFPSFDQFKNYLDRGEKFKQWAREVFSGYSNDRDSSDQ